MRGMLWAVILCIAVPASAETGTLKLGSVVPAGSSWAREIDAFSRQVETATAGQLHIKWYLGAIAGDEAQMLDRVARHQLDGLGSAGPGCERVAPTMRVLNLLGLFQTHEEVAHVLNRLIPVLSEEAARAGFVWLAAAPIGPEVVLSRTPIHDMNELRAVRLHRWDGDEVSNAQARAMGLTIVPLPLTEATRAYDEGKVDAFNFPPSAALAYQAYSRARYLLDLRVGFISACLLVSSASFDRLSVPAQRALREAGAKLAVRFALESRRQDELLLGSIFAKSGVTILPVSPSLRAEFFSAARAAREKLVGSLVPAESLSRVLAILADYHAERGP